MPDKAGDFSLMMDPRPCYVGHYVAMYTAHLQARIALLSGASLIFLKSIFTGSGNFVFAFRSSIFCLFYMFSCEFIFSQNSCLIANTI